MHHFCRLKRKRTTTFRATVNILFHFYKNLFHQEVQAETKQDFKNILRTHPGWESVKNIFILLIFFSLAGTQLVEGGLVRKPGEHQREMSLFTNFTIKWRWPCTTFQDGVCVGERSMREIGSPFILFKTVFFYVPPLLTMAGICRCVHASQRCRQY